MGFLGTNKSRESCITKFNGSEKRYASFTSSLYGKASYIYRANLTENADYTYATIQIRDFKVTTVY